MQILQGSVASMMAKKDCAAPLIIKEYELSKNTRLLQLRLAHQLLMGYVLHRQSTERVQKQPMGNSLLKTRSSAGKLVVVAGLLFAVGLSSLAYAQTAALTSAEKGWLTYIREEEKVARDVYVFLYDVWGSAIFNNISSSEQTHMDAIKNLLDKYGVTDPAAGKGFGEFTNPELQALYDALVAQGSLSLVDALNVGVLIEETDIADINAALALTAKRDIKTVYSNLLRGSNNHLTAFNANLAK